MARRGRPTAEISLSKEERATLELLGASSFVVAGLGASIQDRAGLRGGKPHTGPDRSDLGCNPVTVGKWRGRFAQSRLDGLVDAPGPGAARTIGDDVIEAVVVETLESGSEPGSTWSARLDERR